MYVHVYSPECTYHVRTMYIHLYDFKEIARLNQQVLGDGCNSQITETKLKEQSVFCNQLIHFSYTVLMLETLHW